MRLPNKVAIVTGAGTGIGRACAVALAREGAKVAVVGRRKNLLDEVVREIGAANSLAIPADLTDPKAIDGIVEQTARHFGGIHILVNNAGVLIPGTAETIGEDAWRQSFDTNVTAVWLLSRAVLPYLRKAGGGAIVNVSSLLGLTGAANRVAYAASKGAVTLLTQCMAIDHATENIRVNCVCPGVVETELVADFVRKAPDPAAARRRRENFHAMNRFSQPEEIAPAVVFLASDEASFITGVALPVDGGYMAGKDYGR